MFDHLRLHVSQQRLQQSDLLLVLQHVERCEVVHYGLVLFLPGRVDVLHHFILHLQ